MLTDNVTQQLTIQGQLTELARVTQWVEILAKRHFISETTQFAIELCMEEVLANIILHGYGGNSDRSVTVRFFTPHRGCYVFEVEDEAPIFNPLAGEELPPINSDNETRIGGQGLRLLRRFASQLAYEARANGNRLSMVFDASASPAGASC